MVVRQGACSRRRPQKAGGVEAGPGELAKPLCQLWQEWVSPGAGGFCSDKLPPFPSCTCVCGDESLVELQLGDSAGPVKLGWPGGTSVAGVDLGGGPPYLYVGDQLRRHWSMALGRPGHRCRCSVEANLVSELSNKL